MGFTVEIETIKEKSNVIIPISMDNITDKSGKLQAGEKLQLLVKTLKDKQCKITVLVADTLQKHNVGEDAAKKMGDTFINDNKEVAEDKEIIVYRWEKFLTDKKEKYQKARAFIDENSKKDSVFYNKMNKTAEKCISKKDVESSLELQREEYAAILAMDDFDYLVYPRSITDGMAYLYTPTFKDFKKPQYEISYYKKQNDSLFSSFFNQDDKMPLPLRLVARQIETILASSEISEKDKAIFADKLENMLNLWSHKNNSQKSSDAATIITKPSL